MSSKISISDDVRDFNGATSWAGTRYPYSTTEFPLVLSGAHVSLVYNYFIWSMIQRGSDTSFTNLWSLLLYIQSLLHYNTNLVCYTYFHWLFNPECQHIFGKQTGYICTLSVSLIWAPKNNNNVVDKNRNIYASLNQYHNTE